MLPDFISPSTGVYQHLPRTTAHTRVCGGEDEGHVHHLAVIHLHSSHQTDMHTLLTHMVNCSRHSQQPRRHHPNTQLAHVQPLEALIQYLSQLPPLCCLTRPCCLDSYMPSHPHTPHTECIPHLTPHAPSRCMLHSQIAGSSECPEALGQALQLIVAQIPVKARPGGQRSVITSTATLHETRAPLRRTMLDPPCHYAD